MSGAIVVAAACVLAWAAGPTWAARPVPPPLDDLSLRDVPETGSLHGDELRAWLVAPAPDAVRRGAETYDQNCAVCHGDTGLGYEEAKLSFPADHRTCSRCHRPGNVQRMSFEEMMRRQHDLFDVGEAPPVRGPDALRGFGSDEALFAYLRATMPRYQPGRLDDAAYWDLVAFLRWLTPVAPAGSSASGSGTTGSEPAARR